MKLFKLYTSSILPSSHLNLFVVELASVWCILNLSPENQKAHSLVFLLNKTALKSHRDLECQQLNRATCFVIRQILNSDAFLLTQRALMTYTCSAPPPLCVLRPTMWRAPLIWLIMFRGPKAWTVDDDEFSMDCLIWKNVQALLADLQPS